MTGTPAKPGVTEAAAMDFIRRNPGRSLSAVSRATGAGYRTLYRLIERGTVRLGNAGEGRRRTKLYARGKGGPGNA